jgi:tetratricopeptide (TPR) repeat protein
LIKDRPRVSSWRRVAWPAVVVAGILLACWSESGIGQEGWSDIADLVRAGRYAEARDLGLQRLEASDEAAPLWWRVRLETEPDAALAALREAAAIKDLPLAIRIEFVQEEAALLFARGDYQEALTCIETLRHSAREPLPGRVHLLAGMAYRALQQTQKSREAFATIPQSDPGFPWARFCLGRIALDQGETALAMRYFESAEKSESARREPALLGGLADAFRRDARPEEALALEESILERFPQSLVALQLREASDSAAEPSLPAGAAAPDPALMSEPSLDSPEIRGRFQLQLAAFSDRGRALTYLAAWQDRLPDLHIHEETGAAGQTLYKVRTGRFSSRMEAQTEARRLQSAHGLSIMIVEDDR